MISRRSLLRHGATATALAGVAVATVQCQSTEAPATEHDPFLVFMDEYNAAEGRFENLDWPMPDEDANAACDTMIMPWLSRIRSGDMPAATTAEGAAAALREILRYGGIEQNPGDEPLLRLALAFLEGRASA